MAFFYFIVRFFCFLFVIHSEDQNVSKTEWNKNLCKSTIKKRLPKFKRAEQWTYGRNAFEKCIIYDWLDDIKKTLMMIYLLIISCFPVSVYVYQLSQLSFLSTFPKVLCFFSFIQNRLLYRPIFLWYFVSFFQRFPNQTYQTGILEKNNYSKYFIHKSYVTLLHKWIRN